MNREDISLTELAEGYLNTLPIGTKFTKTQIALAIGEKHARDVSWFIKKCENNHTIKVYEIQNYKNTKDSHVYIKCDPDEFMPVHDYMQDFLCGVKSWMI